MQMLFGQPMQPPSVSAPPTVGQPAFGFGQQQQSPQPGGTQTMLCGQSVGSPPAQGLQGFAAAPVAPAFGRAALHPSSGFGFSPPSGAAPQAGAGPAELPSHNNMRAAQRKQRFGGADGGGPQQGPFGAGGRAADEGEEERRNARMSRFSQGGEANKSKDDEEVVRAPRPRRASSRAPQSAAAALGGGDGSYNHGGRATAGADMEESAAGAEVDPEAMVVVGVCEEMCPAAERQRREQNGELHTFERVEQGNPKLTSYDLIVKRNVRNYMPEDRLPTSFRTMAALDKTMRHLRAIMDWTTNEHPDAQPITIYSFLWDRYREVRKEISTQRFNTNPALLPQVLAWNEEVARYHIACSHELINTDEFSPQLNQEQLNKIILDLLGDYRTCVDLGVPTPNSSEFKCYMAIMTFFGLENKGGNKIPNKVGAFEVLRSFTSYEQDTSWFPVTLGTLTAMANMDLRAFMQLIKSAPYPLACVLFAHYGDMKEHGFRIAPAAYNAFEDPQNVVPMTALAPFFDLSANGIKAKCRGMGAELGPYPDDPTIEAVRFPHPSTLSYAAAKKQALPYISKKSGSGRAGISSVAIVNPPALSQALLDLIARIQGKPPGTFSPHHQPPPIFALPSPTQPSPPPSAFPFPQQQQPSHRVPSPAPPLYGAQSPLSPFPHAAADAGVAAGQTQPPARSPFAPSHQPFAPIPSASGASTSLPPAQAGGAGPSLASPPSVSQSYSQQVVPGSPTIAGAGKGPPAFAAPVRSSPGATVEAVAQAQAAAEAAIGQARAQEARSRQVQEALQQQVAAQAQQLQQHALQQQQQYLRQLEELQRSARQQTEQLEQQVAAQAAQLASLSQQRQLAEAELRKRRTHEKGDQLRASLERFIQQRTLARWRANTLSQKQQEARAQEQLARCRIDKVARGIPPSSAFFLHPHTPTASPDVTAPPVAAGKRRRQEVDPMASFLPISPHPIPSTSSPSLPVPGHLPLPLLVIPGLRTALSQASAAAASMAASSHAAPAKPWTCPPQQLQQQAQVQEQAQQMPLFWKVVLSTGVPLSEDSGSAAAVHKARPATLPQPAAPSTSPVSSVQVAAASWLRAKLACGRNGASMQPATGELLTLLHRVPLNPETDFSNAPLPAIPSHATLCIEALDPQAVAADAPPLPRYSNRSMAATSGILLLVSGPSLASTQPTQLCHSHDTHTHRPSLSHTHTAPPRHPHDTHADVTRSPSTHPTQQGHGHTHHPISSFHSPHAPGPYAANGCSAGHQAAIQTQKGAHLSAGVQAELAGSWEDLLRLLSGLAPGVQVPLVVLALTDTFGIGAVHAHFEATAKCWPHELRARIAQWTVLPLLPQQQAEAGLIQGLCELSRRPPNPLLASGCCNGWGLGTAWGLPQRVTLESVVRSLMEACLQQEGDASAPQDIVCAFNEGLAALAHGIHCTATSNLATWGLPPPETMPIPDLAAPLCWHQQRTAEAAQELLAAQVPIPQQPAPSAASVLHARFALWASLRTGPSHCLLLPQYLAAATPTSTMLSHTPATASSPYNQLSPFLTRSPGGFAVRTASAPTSSVRMAQSLSPWLPSVSNAAPPQQASWGNNNLVFSPKKPPHYPSTVVQGQPLDQEAAVELQTVVGGASPSDVLKQKAQRILQQLGHLVPGTTL